MHNYCKVETLRLVYYFFDSRFLEFGLFKKKEGKTPETLVNLENPVNYEL